MEKIVFGDPVTDFLNDFGFHQGNMIGGRFTGKVICQILSAIISFRGSKYWKMELLGIISKIPHPKKF